MEMDMKICVNINCDRVAFDMCSRCGDPYCSVECQDRNWNQHRYICFPKPALIPIVFSFNGNRPCKEDCITLAGIRKQKQENDDCDKMEKGHNEKIENLKNIIAEFDIAIENERLKAIRKHEANTSDASNDIDPEITFFADTSIDHTEINGNATGTAHANKYDFTDDEIITASEHQNYTETLLGTEIAGKSNMEEDKPRTVTTVDVGTDSMENENAITDSLVNDPETGKDVEEMVPQISSDAKEVEVVTEEVVSEELIIENENNVESKSFDAENQCLNSVNVEEFIAEDDLVKESAIVDTVKASASNDSGIVNEINANSDNESIASEDTIIANYIDSFETENAPLEEGDISILNVATDEEIPANSTLDNATQIENMTVDVNSAIEEEQMEEAKTEDSENADNIEINSGTDKSDEYGSVSIANDSEVVIDDEKENVMKNAAKKVVTFKNETEDIDCGNQYPDLLEFMNEATDGQTTVENDDVVTVNTLDDIIDNGKSEIPPEKIVANEDINQLKENGANGVIKNQMEETASNVEIDIQPVNIAANGDINQPKENGANGVIKNQMEESAANVEIDIQPVNIAANGDINQPKENGANGVIKNQMEESAANVEIDIQPVNIAANGDINQPKENGANGVIKNQMEESAANVEIDIQPVNIAANGDINQPKENGANGVIKNQMEEIAANVEIDIQPVNIAANGDTENQMEKIAANGDTENQLEQSAGNGEIDNQRENNVVNGNIKNEPKNIAANEDVNNQLKEITANEDTDNQAGNIGANCDIENQMENMAAGGIMPRQLSEPNRLPISPRSAADRPFLKPLPVCKNKYFLEDLVKIPLQANTEVEVKLTNIHELKDKIVHVRPKPLHDKLRKISRLARNQRNLQELPEKHELILARCGDLYFRAVCIRADSNYSILIRLLDACDAFKMRRICELKKFPHELTYGYGTHRCLVQNLDEGLIDDLKKSFRGKKGTDLYKKMNVLEVAPEYATVTFK